MVEKHDNSASTLGAASPGGKPIAFFGTPEVSVVCAEALRRSGQFDIRLIVTQPDKPAGRGKVLTGSPLKQWAQSHDIPVITPSSIKRDADTFLNQLRQFGNLEALVVVSFGQILPQALLNAYPGRCINVHFSLLPRWRGANPTQRAILAGDTETGVCLMQMEAGLDTGPVFAVKSATVSETDTLDSLLARLSGLGGSMLVEYLPAILKGELKPTPQPQDGASHAAKLSPVEMVINWNNSASEISRQIRALWSAPGASSNYRKQRVKFVPDEHLSSLAVVDSGEVVPALPDSQPGQILSCDKRGIIIKCGQGFLKINSLQFPGGRPLKAAEISNGRKLQVGEYFEGEDFKME